MGGGGGGGDTPIAVSRQLSLGDVYLSLNPIPRLSPNNKNSLVLYMYIFYGNFPTDTCIRRRKYLNWCATFH